MPELTEHVHTQELIHNHSVFTTAPCSCRCDHPILQMGKWSLGLATGEAGSEWQMQI